MELEDGPYSLPGSASVASRACPQALSCLSLMAATAPPLPPTFRASLLLSQVHTMPYTALGLSVEVCVENIPDSRAMLAEVQVKIQSFSSKNLQRNQTDGFLP